MTTQLNNIGGFRRGELVVFAASTVSGRSMVLENAIREWLSKSNA